MTDNDLNSKEVAEYLKGLLKRLYPDYGFTISMDTDQNWQIAKDGQDPGRWVASYWKTPTKSGWMFYAYTHGFNGKFIDLMDEEELLKWMAVARD